MKRNTSHILQSLLSSVTLSSQLKVVLLILERYNPRVGEVLRAERRLFIPHRMLIIKGSKGSQDVIIRDLMILDMIEELPILSKTYLFPSLNYGILYRTIKKDYAHLFSKFKTRHNEKVTHGFRYLNANLTNDPAAVKSILNHTTTKSGTSYNKKLPI